MDKPRTGFNTPIPESILTPDRVSTRIGELEFFDGLPTAAAAKRVFENLDFVRGVEAFLNVGANADGSFDLHFRPTAPEHEDANWIQTVPGKGWFTILRLYVPLERWFERTSRPGEIELT